MFRALKGSQISLKRAVGAFLISIIPGVAHADRSCDDVFARLRDVTAAGLQSHVHVLWTTNYFVPERDALFLGTTEIVLRRQRGDLFGSASRAQTIYSLDRSKPAVHRTDWVSLRLTQNGQLTINERYGPFDPFCASGKFAVVNAGDAVEVFNLDPRQQ